MRRLLALVLVAVLALLASLGWRAREPRFVEPVPAAAPAPRVEVALDENPERLVRESVVEPAPGVAVAPTAADAADEPRCTVTFVLAFDDARAGDPRSIPQIGCTDLRGRGVELRFVDAHTAVAERVRADRYRLHAYVPGHEPGNATFEVMPGEREKRVDLRFESRPTSVSRLVLVRWQTEDGAPFVPTLANAWKAKFRGNLLVRRVPGGSSGTPVPKPEDAHLPARSVGRSRPGAPMDSFTLVRVSADEDTDLEACLDDRVLSSFRVAPRDDEVVIRTSVDDVLAQLGGVRGCVVGADDRVPIAGAIVSFEGPPYRTGGMGSPCPDGTFAFDGRTAGEARLRIEAGGAVVARDVAIEAGRVLDLGEIAVPSGCSLRARMVDASGGPVSGARLLCASTAVLASATVSHFGQGRLARSDRAEVNPAPADEAFLIVQSSGHGLSAMAIPACGHRRDELEVRLLPGVEVVLDLGLGSPETSVRLATANGIPLGDQPTSSTGLVAVELAPGDYVARRGTAGEETRFRVQSEPLAVRLR